MIYAKLEVSLFKIFIHVISLICFPIRYNDNLKSKISLIINIIILSCVCTFIQVIIDEKIIKLIFWLCFYASLPLSIYPMVNEMYSYEPVKRISVIKTEIKLIKFFIRNMFKNKIILYSKTITSNGIYWRYNVMYVKGFRILVKEINHSRLNKWRTT